ncbi:hypothetical protein C7K25_08715 [Gulosibacter molinativorax]|uniref:PLD phosphodiesterase domain-containing protein n=1 Tax=Gulosibacter molinativorax TaxID=256821 RepID=A0ABT7C8C2_9MICO|nr:hypothetical protein [Gulosibacter molinativorax]QUY62946.1 Hypotetical protein [Gulosibacter molinativorax]
MQAVGTTFTLDLVSALAVPLSFSSRRLGDHNDPVSIFTAIRQAADSIDVFAQAGVISLGRETDLVTYLEGGIHPVALHRGIFHPKVWLLEFARDAERSFRLVSSSRNLTADKSWDIVVRLDGKPAAAAGEPSDESALERRAAARARNEPIQRLIRALPDFCVNRMPEHRVQRIHDFAERFGEVEWERPDDTHDLAFHTFGLGDASIPQIRGTKALIISPFLSDDGLERLRTGISGETHLLSRERSLQLLNPEAFDPKLHTYLLDEAANLVDEEDAKAENLLTGLHAKAVIVNANHRARMLLGSANATGAGWGTNVEFMVEFEGRRDIYGVDATLEALGELKAEFEPTGGEVEDEREQAQHELDSVLRDLAIVPVTSRIVEGEPFTQLVWAGSRLTNVLEATASRGIGIRWHLLTVKGTDVAELGTSEAHAARFERLDLTDLTAFLVAVGTHPATGLTKSTIIPMRLLDDVEERKEAVIARHLADPQAFVRLLTLLLELSGMRFEATKTGGGMWGAFASDGQATSGLFEALVRALGRGSSGIEEAQRIIEFLRRERDVVCSGDAQSPDETVTSEPPTSEQSVLPEGFEPLWDAVWAAHLKLRGRETDD